MAQKQRVKLKLFGALGSAAGGSELELEVDQAATVRDLRSELKQKLDQHAILDSCAFASTNKVLRDSEEIGQLSELAVLPPVCGG